MAGGSVNFNSLCMSVGRVLSDLCDGTELASDVAGMTSPKVKALLNGIVGLSPGWRHLEVGTHQGATFIAAMQGNMDAYGVSYDNFSQFWHCADSGGCFTSSALARNMAKYKDRMGTTELVRKDFFKNPYDWPSVTRKELMVFDSFFYDGNHDEEWQEKAVIAAFKCCADNFVYIVDDWNLPGVRDGTLRGFERSHPKNTRHWNLGKEYTGDDFYEGIGLFVVSK